MGAALQYSGRCPRCGYALRFDGRGYRCDFCGYPNIHRTFTDTLQNLESNLRLKLQNILQGDRRIRFQYMPAARPTAIPQQLCVSCGVRIPAGLEKCPYCGAVQALAQANPSPSSTANAIQIGDQKVFDYITAHNGTISLSQAVQDLSISLDALQLTIERLKAAGLLQQA